ncbi:hypothetical protein GQX73_g3142 [Xylaria multiplex]|uniref:Uncharacterized protein n=1 Tax=Xylaria multiplex TaxID=323545 RepID=A0A7C8MSM3_9PEZI|nr:hypothetical protein GQX73_g3142 [Xylaria multiplex]
MSQKSLARRQNFEILCDSPSLDNQPLPDHREPAPSQPRPLRRLSVSQAQNRQFEQVKLGTDVHELNPVEKRVGGRLIRPCIAPNTFEVLNTVAKPESQTQSVPAAPKVPDDAQRVLQLPVGRYSSHPLSIAARSIPPLEVQLAKHHDSLFEWILAVTLSGDSKSQLDNSSGVENSKGGRKVYFGCNLLPEPYPRNDGVHKTDSLADSYLLLVTPVEETNDVLEIFRSPIGNSKMAVPEINIGHSTPEKTSEYDSLRGDNEITPNSTLCTRGDDSSVGSTASRSPGDPVRRIEDSLEALDMLEDQLEAFDKVARFNQFIPKEQTPSNRKLTVKTEFATSSPCVRFATPQPQHTLIRPSSVCLRVKSASEPRRTALRKVTSMNLDPHKFKAEEKTWSQHSPNMSAVRGTTDSSPRSLVASSTKQRMVSTYELPGDAVARQLKEKKEARLVSQRATQPTMSSLRRAKSAKLPTRPAFELPGEAISRRKREEHQAQLKSQEDEEKKETRVQSTACPLTHGACHGAP